MPALSVVMPVRDAGPFLDEAVGSILAQTFGDFEFVILDDGSTDGSLDRLRRWAGVDKRIRLLEGGASLGPAGSSNRVVAEALEPLIARMDADDRAHPERLAMQMEAFQREPDLVLLGTLASTIDAAGRQVRAPDYARLTRKSVFAPFGHSSIMFRKDAFVRSGGYRAVADKWEDVDLYLRMAELGRVMVLGHPLVEIRQWHGNTRASGGAFAYEEALHLMNRCVAEYRSGRDFERLLEAPRQAGKLWPQAFVIGSTRAVWTGERPLIWRRLRKRGELALNSASLAALVWAAWADLSPRSLRAALRALLAGRNLVARKRLAGRTIVQWRPQDARAANIQS